MKYKLEEKAKNKAVFTFTLDAEEWEIAIQKAYIKTKGKYSQPGFRKGHVPRRVLEGLYGKGMFFEEAFNVCFPTYYTQALEKEKQIIPVDRPDLDVKNIAETGVEFTATVVTKPDVTLGEYKNLTYKKASFRVTEADVDAEVLKAAERLARLIEVTDRAVKAQDTVLIDYSGSVDGKKFDGGTAEKQTLEIGSNSFIPGFEEQVIGMKLNEQKDLTVTFPTDYHADDLKGKQAIFHVVLHEIKEKQLPKLDDEFAKDVSECKTLAEYKKQIKEKLSEERKKKSESESENDLIEKIVKKVTVDIPDCMVEHEIDDMVQEMSYRFMYQGLKLEDYLKYTGSTLEKMRTEYKETALKNVKTRLVIEKIVKTENITASDEEVDEKVKEIAAQAKKDFTEYKASMQERQLDYIKSNVITDKLFAYLKQNNKAQ